MRGRTSAVHRAVSYVAAASTAFACTQDRAEVIEAEVIEARIPVNGAALLARVVGQGEPVIVLHGGPDFDHGYLLPDLDRFGDALRLVYYDQRGRGRSAENVVPEDVSLASDVEDVDRVRQYFGLEAPALLGHSWGTVLALEYALLHPARVSRLILMNPAPSSHLDLEALRSSYVAELGPEMDRQREILSSPSYLAGDPATVAARYRIHFRHALHRTEDYERLMAAMAAAFDRQGSEGILKARAVEAQLFRDTWDVPDWDMLPSLRALRVPTLVIAGEDDFIPLDVARRLADAIPDAELVTIGECGHFAYLECPDEVRRALDAFLQR